MKYQYVQREEIAIRKLKTHTDEVILVFGIIGIFAISYWYGILSNGNGKAFLNAILPSAFVDIISIIVTTLLITNLIESRRTYADKKRMYQIINIPHSQMVHKMIWRFKYLIAAEPDEIYKKYLKEDMDIKDIKDFFYKRVNQNFQSDIILVENPENNLVINAESAKQYIKKRRIELMEEYCIDVIKSLEDFIKDYSHIATPEYLGLLVELREYLKIDNPLRVIYYDNCLEPTVIEIEKFTKDNQEYLDKVLKIKNYFNEV